MVKAFTHAANRDIKPLNQTVEVEPDEVRELDEADRRAEARSAPIPTAAAAQPVQPIPREPAPAQTAPAPAQFAAMPAATPVDTLFTQTAATAKPTPAAMPMAKPAAQTTAPAPAVETPAPAPGTDVEQAHEPTETVVMPAILNFKPEQSRGNIELKNGAVLRKVTFRMTPDNIVLVKTVAAQRNLPVQAVFNALVEEGLKDGRCDLHTAEQFLQYHKA